MNSPTASSRRYVHEEIDAVYIVYNEFKSVIAQRLVVEKLLPLIDFKNPQIAGAVEPTKEEKERAAEAAHSAGIEIEPSRHRREADEEAEEIPVPPTLTTFTSSPPRNS